MNAPEFAIFSHPDCLLHEMGRNHPECPDRLPAIMDQLIATGLDIHFLHMEAPLAEIEAIRRVHSRDYVERIIASSPESGHLWLDPDTAMNPHTLSAAMRAAGAVVSAVDHIVSGKIKSAFCNIRPPGHHATRNRSMGFCIFNNVAIGAAHALEHHGLERVAIVDFDVHHGNGTEDIFSDNPAVMMTSIFQHPFYPFSGIEGRSKRMINIPLPAGSDGKALREAVEKYWIPALEAFMPEMIFFSAGFDAHRDDDMAGLNFVDADYAWMTLKIKEIADKHANGRMISTLEGGYELHALGRAAAAHIRALAGL
ncbi:MAG: histone deacetylase family protein [Burkholderiales bacterium]|nr:histone deacetylase family protein [Burkholderiales bacterium]